MELDTATSTEEEEKQEDTMEDEEEESSDEDDESWNCADEEIKKDLEYAITAIFKDNRDRVMRERFHFILQLLLS